MPVIDGPCSDVSYITPCLASRLQSAFILPKTIRFTKRTHHGSAYVRMERFESVDLLEQIKVALIAALESLVRLFAAKNIHCTLVLLIQVSTREFSRF